jgi:hypothetical protein
MTPADVILLMDVLFEVRIALAPDGEHLAVTGNAAAIECATPKLTQMKPELLGYLRATTNEVTP